MTRLIDGPAAGQTLMIHRAPFLLRVTMKNVKGKIKCDALDQPHDKPEPGETLFAYKWKSAPAGHVHVRMKGGGGFYPMAEYTYVREQPSQATMQSTARWQEWTHKPEFEAEYDEMQKRTEDPCP